LLKIEFFRFAVVGVIATLIHMGILMVFVEHFKINPVHASIVGFLVAVITSYFLNYRWTFQSSQAHIATLWRYVTVAIIGLTLNTVIMTLAINIFQWWYVSSQIAALSIVPLSNYLLNRYWTFSAQI
jgi:putative flippase GtrA